MPIVRRAEDSGYLRRFLRLVRNVDVTSEYRALDVCFFKDQIDEFYLVRATNAWRRDLQSGSVARPVA